MTQSQAAKSGQITDEMKQVAEFEGRSPEEIRAGVASGRVVICRNTRGENRLPVGIGKDLRTKVNANIGTSPDASAEDQEIEKLRVALEAGADTVMDLSVGGDIDAVRRRVLDESTVPVGTVPVYQSIAEILGKKRPIVDLSEDEIVGMFERHAKDGVDFATIHCGVTLAVLDRLKEINRVIPIVSRGASLLAEWMVKNGKENPLYAQYDSVLEIAEAYDVTLSLGDGLRPGALADATDGAQIAELIVIGELVERARARGVQVMVEGPGHVPLHQVAANVILEKKICDEAPFYVLGPLVTDVACGYDHITGAIGGAIAAAAGADFLCYVTPAEHLGLPNREDVRDGVMASRIAAHAGDIAKGLPGAAAWDRKMSEARGALDWKAMIGLAMDPVRAEKMRSVNPPEDDDLCSMCGEFCAVKKSTEIFKDPTA
ncbi:MAG: phosphomethylpyrimidine synthase ThiC [Candidatus Eisenbacteria sp.]|nr:phosphomethylpyrimidine synthase ThiC [Candidatus Eisenbacteria bacterium]